MWMASIVAFTLGLFVLAFIVRANPESDLDVRLLEEIGRWGETPLEGWYHFLSSITGQWPALLSMALAVVVTLIISKPNNAVALAVTLALVGSVDLVLGYVLAEFVGVERPDPASSQLSFPSGHVAYITSAGLMMVYIALLRRTHVVLLGVLILSLGFLLYSVGVSRLLLDEHWPSDVLGGYILGVLGPLVFIPVYHRMEIIRWIVPPRVGIDVPSSGSPGAIIAGSYGSAVVIEPEKGTARKYFNPPVLLRALYWMSFQKEFPYVRNVDALEAAVYRRRIAGLITKYRFGKDLVSQIKDVEWYDGKACMVTEYIAGDEPEDNVEAWDFLLTVEALFEEAGLPGWQLNPHNPHAHTNLVRTPDGDFFIIDMESGFVTPLPAPSRVRRSLKLGTLPVFDDMDFGKLREFVTERAADLHRRLGPVGYAELIESVEKGEAAYNRWHGGETRIWGRTVRFVYRLLNISADFAVARRGMASAQQRASLFMEKGIERWESEGRISEERADSLRAELADDNVQVAMEHFGAHMLISVVLRFPLGSIARFLWTLTFMVRAADANVRFRGRTDTGGLKIHNPLVLIWSAIPGFGAVAYVFSGPLLKPSLIRLAMDETLYEMPFRIYTRFWFNRWLPPRKSAMDRVP